MKELIRLRTEMEVAKDIYRVSKANKLYLSLRIEAENKYFDAVEKYINDGVTTESYNSP